MDALENAQQPHWELCSCPECLIASAARLMELERDIKAATTRQGKPRRQTGAVVRNLPEIVVALIQRQSIR